MRRSKDPLFGPWPAIACEVDKNLNAAQDLSRASVEAFQQVMDGLEWPSPRPSRPRS